MIRNSNPDFWINRDSDPNVRWITPKMLRIDYYVYVNHFAESCENCEMWNANKSPKIRYSATVREVEKWSRICIRDWITTKS